MKKFIVLIFICTNLYSQSTQIFIDEIFDDWNKIENFVEDGEEQLENEMDYKKLWVSNDSNYIFLRLDLYNEVLIQEDTNATIFINTDNDFSTGTQEYNSGAEIKFNFGLHFGYFYYDSDSIQIFQNDLKYISAPTVSSSTYEISIQLNSSINGSKLFSSDTLYIKFLNYYSRSDKIPNDNEMLKYILDRNKETNYKEINLARNNETDIRFVSYNVHRDDIFLEEKENSYKRIFSAIEPDIISFQEIYNHSSEEVADLINNFIPLGAGENWYHSKVEPINTYNFTDNIVVSKYQIINSFRIQGYVYPPYGIDHSNAAYLIDLPNTDKNLLLIVAHPPCCSNYSLRQVELQEIMSFIKDAKEPGGEIDIEENSPIIISGDMNLVGPSEERDILIYGNMIDNSMYGEDFNPDWDNTSFADAHPYTTGYPGVITWYRETDMYSPGRLDYFIYSDYTLNLENNYVLFSKKIPDEILDEYNLESDDNLIASDHLPLVSDFSLSNVVGVYNSELPLNFIKLFQNYPNPFNPITKISYSIPESKNVLLTVYDLLGREVSTLVNEKQNAGNYEIEFDGSRLTAGVYFYQLRTNDFIETKKLILLK